ncbi:hypothetical protein ACFX58_14520 [Sphingomonas sp. NCPPB 2930]
MNQPASEQSIFADMSNLEKTLSEDITGDKARAIVQYFQSVGEATDKMLASAKEESQRHLISRLLRGFQASERVVRQVWESIHGVALVF